MNIRDCGLGVQGFYWPSTTFTEMPQPVNNAHLVALDVLTDGGQDIVDSKFMLMAHNTATTIYNPMNGPVHCRVEWWTPRKDIMAQGVSSIIAAAETDNSGWNQNYVGATLGDSAYWVNLMKPCRKTVTFKLSPGAHKTISMRHVRRAGGIAINLNEGRFNQTDDSAGRPFLWAGISKIMILSFFGTMSQNNMNTESVIAQSSVSQSRLVISTRYRTIFRPMVFAGVFDKTSQINIYNQGYRTEYSDDGVPLITTMYRNAILDDDNVTPTGFGTNAALAASDNRVQTHDT